MAEGWAEKVFISMGYYDLSATLMTDVTMMTCHKIIPKKSSKIDVCLLMLFIFLINGMLPLKSIIHLNIMPFSILVEAFMPFMSQNLVYI